MESRKCPNCNAQLELSRSKTTLECPYCGSKFDIDAEVKEKITKAENDLTKKLDDATADLKQDLLTVDNRYKDLCAQLDSKIQSARDALNAEIAKHLS